MPAKFVHPPLGLIALKDGMRTVLICIILSSIGLGLSGCVVASVVGTAVSVTGTAVGAAADVAGTAVDVGTDAVSGDDCDDGKDC